MNGENADRLWLKQRLECKVSKLSHNGIIILRPVDVLNKDVSEIFTWIPVFVDNLSSLWLMRRVLQGWSTI